MFYHYDLLKKNGRFHICWIADAYPGSFSRIPSRQLRQFHVSQLCDDLQAVISSEAISPQQRFSLRLSSQLIFGLLRLYKRQLDLLISDLLSFDVAVRKGVERLHEPNKKKKSKRPTLFEHEIPLQELDLVNLNNTNVVQNVDQITLREETIPPTIVVNDGFGDEHNPLLDLLGLPEDVLRMQDTTLLDQTTFQMQVDVHMDQFGRKSERVAIPQQDDHNTMLDTTKRPSLRASVIELDEAQNAPNTSNPMEGINMMENIDLPVIPEIVLPASPMNVEVPIAETPGKTQEESVILAEITTPPEQINRKRKIYRMDDGVDGKIISDEIIKKYLFHNNIHQRCKLPIEDIVRLGCHLTASRLMVLPFLESKAVRLSSHMLRGGDRLHHLFTRNMITRPEASMQLKSLTRRKTREREVARVAEQEQSLRNITAANITMNQTVEQMRTLPFIPEDDQQHLMITSPLRKPTNLTITDPRLRPRKRSDNLTIPNESTSANLPQIELQTTMNEITDITMADLNINTTNIQTDVTTNMDTIQTNNINVDLQIDSLLEEINAQRNISNDPNEENVAEFNEDLKEGDNLDKRGEGELLEDGKGSCRKSCNETGLGSLDRTSVSLGEEDLTASQNAVVNYLSKEWSPEAFLEKVFTAKKQKICPLTLEKIVKGYVIPTDVVSMKFVMARAFMSLLRLKRSAILSVKKKEDLSILHITVSDQLKEKMIRAQGRSPK